MIGRFLGAIALGKLNISSKFLLMILVSGALTLFMVYSVGDIESELSYYVIFQALAILLI
jgi:hypothetical protein